MDVLCEGAESESNQQQEFGTAEAYHPVIMQLKWNKWGRCDYDIIMFFFQDHFILHRGLWGYVIPHNSFAAQTNTVEDLYTITCRFVSNAENRAVFGASCKIASQIKVYMA